jgi:hypothetical protein
MTSKRLSRRYRKQESIQMSALAALKKILPAADPYGEIDRMNTPSALVLSTVMLCVIVAGIALVSVATSPFAGLGPVSRASASILPHVMHTGSIARLDESDAGFRLEAFPGHAVATRSEATMTGLRSFVLTGEEEFLTGWQKSVDRLRADVSRLRQSSSGWSDGEKLRKLSDLERHLQILLEEQERVAALTTSGNRYPGVRLYSEDIRPRLMEAQARCASLIDVLLARPGGGPAGAVDALAKMRLALKNVSQDMADFVVQGSSISSDAMTAAVVELEVSATSLGEQLHGMQPEDAEAARALLDAVSSLAAPMDNVVALRGVAQWDFARFTFDEKVIPRYHEFVAVLRHLS